MGYLEYQALDTGKVEIQQVEALEIPAPGIDLERRLQKIDKVTKLQKRLSNAARQFTHYEEMVQSAMLGKHIEYDEETIEFFDAIVEESENLVKTLRASLEINSDISMLNTNFRELASQS